MLPYIQVGINEELVGRLGEQHCDRCKGTRPFGSIGRYGYVRLFYLFGIAKVTGYDAACLCCGLRHPIRRKQIAELRRAGQLTPPLIPPLTQYGWVILVCLIGLVYLLAVYGSLVLVTAGMMIVVAVLASILKGLRRGGVKGYTQELREGERPISLFESVGGLAPQKQRAWWKCAACGLNNTASTSACERCNALKTP